ncbi:hypothetical protein M422DRAFT_248748 [Sphaerobolus stellatus SS14]|nr:hypothetical protein M422DRAFT_248748 [Sphaerobolus stellatus SS14]
MQMTSTYPDKHSNGAKAKVTKHVHPKLSDLDRTSRAIVRWAIQDHCSKLATQNPFPNAVEEHMAANASLMRAEVALELKIETEGIYDIAIQLVEFIVG